MSLPDNATWAALKMIIQNWIEESDVPGSVSTMPMPLNRASVEKFIQDIDELLSRG